jgi:hypothetical protein
MKHGQLLSHVDTDIRRSFVESWCLHHFWGIDPTSDRAYRTVETNASLTVLVPTTGSLPRSQRKERMSRSPESSKSWPRAPIAPTQGWLDFPGPITLPLLKPLTSLLMRPNIATDASSHTRHIGS